MSMREVDRLKTIQAVVDGGLRVGQAAQRLGLSRRQVERLLLRYRAQGATGLLSLKRGRPSNHQLPAGLAERAIGLIRKHYADFGPTLAAEKLQESHGVLLSKETVRQLMIAAGLWVPRKQRLGPVHQPRSRRACLGELVQIDGSDHAWFEDRAEPCTLLVFVDDATSRLMQLHFVPTESTFAYFEALHGYLRRHGKPVAFYSDKAGIFRPTNESAQSGRGVTQFGRALYELNIEGWCANSSQAKGRVERAHLTLQDRLVKELRLRGICSREAANAFVPHFMADYNARFAKPPRSTFDAHRPLRSDEDLDAILTWRVQRKVSQSLTLQHDSVIYLLPDTPDTRSLAMRYIDVWEYPDGRIELRAQGHVIPYERYDRLQTIDAGAVVEHKRLSHALQVAQLLQAQRDDRRAASTPSRTHAGAPVRQSKPAPGTKRSQRFTVDDLHSAIEQLSTTAA
ncbi:ISNCY family transposase [uncultured Azohydromonas sp.]|uniref:ISNCY family transposase n=1 Tax=uncultured Azohydromonas sp. TaxID=487342 RepID=UPI002636BE30|nr:ISNCY family transposase [uncultured Azohydromonas sp.]